MIFTGSSINGRDVLHYARTNTPAVVELSGEDVSSFSRMQIRKWSLQAPGSRCAA